MKKLISLILPVYNEGKNIKPLYQEINSIWEKELATNYRIEIIFVDDGSTDESPRVIDELARVDKRVKCLYFSRNFGKEAAISAGLHHATGAAAITLDSDFQHPPLHIPKFVAQWELGAEVVVGIPLVASPQKLSRRVGSSLFYWFIKLVGEANIDLHSTDYRLLDRSVIQAFKSLPERNRITRGLIDWLGFKRSLLPIHIPARPYGQSRYTWQALLKLSLSGLVSHSLFPLRSVGLLGVGITLFAVGLGSAIFVDQFLLDDPLNLHISSLGLLALFILFLVGIVLVSQGFLALYIANIHREVSKRPLYIVRKKRNFS